MLMLTIDVYKRQDPDHEEPSYFEESFAHIIKKYGWNKVIYPLLYAHSFVHSQHNLEIFTIDDAKKMCIRDSPCTKSHFTFFKKSN